VKKGLLGSIFFLVALTLLLLTMPFILVTVALVLNIWLPQWAGFAIVVGLMIACAGLLALLGYRRMRRIRGPRKTISSMKDTAAALKRRDSNQPREH
jgi:membrane protein implicated in regulation of membrane protease activity